MKKFFSYKTLLPFLSVLFGIFYYFLIQVSVDEVQHSNSKASTFSFTLNSNIDQKVKLQIATERYKLRSVECNDEQIVFPEKKMQWFEGVGEQVIFSLEKGENRCKVQTYNSRRAYTPAIKQKITFFDYSILFLLLGMPLFHLIFAAFVWGLDQIKSRPKYERKGNGDFIAMYPLRGSPEQSEAKAIDSESRYTYRIIFFILFTGIIIRILYFQKFGIMVFQHDWHGHIEFIKYLADNWILPMASKGLEYPQQPLYYVVTGGLYSLLTYAGLNDQDALYGLGYFSLFCSMVFLYYAYRFMTLITQSVWVRTVAMLFISLTPSLVYLSARINNDSLVMALSAFSLYYIVKSYQSGFKADFYKALTGVSLLFMTKISAAPMELLLFGLLISAYYQVEYDKRCGLKKKLYWFSALGAFLLGFTLLRVYLPIENVFHMVNSSGKFPGQIIETLNFAYFASFNIVSLFNTGYSHSLSGDAVRYSFLTYQYGTMLFGEFDYTYFLQKSGGLREVMQAILLFGLLYVLGFVMYLIKLHRAPILHKFLFATLLLNLLLILKFMFSFPVVCNTDFRYFVASFILFAFVFAKGLDNIRHTKWLGYMINVLLGLLAVSEVLFFTLLLI